MKAYNFYLRLESDPLLYQKLEDFDFSSNIDPIYLESIMIGIMEQNGGIGISANQVGFDHRVIVVKPQGQAPLALFNPVILNINGDCADEEGCLSFPNLYIKISRPNMVSVKYLDKYQKECTITLTGMDAKCIQHEIDHLNGITFTRRVSKLKLNLARKKQRKINGRAK